MEIRNINEIYKTEILGERKEKLESFRALLLEYNQRYNLTTILEEKDVYYKHFLDSAAGVDLFEKNAKVAEIGSGAGFPSIVSKIFREDLSFDLFESLTFECPITYGFNIIRNIDTLKATAGKCTFTDISHSTSDNDFRHISTFTEGIGPY